MKKSILKLGKSLNRSEQKEVVGGFFNSPCPPSTNFILVGGNSECGLACSYPSTLADTTFPGSRCYGSRVGDFCVVDC